MRAIGILAAALLLAAACSKRETRTDTTTMGSAAGVVTTMPTVTPPAAPVQLSDANFVDMVQLDDSTEIKLGKLGESKGTNAGVKSYARMLVSDHAANARAVALLIRKDSLAPQTAPNDTSALEHQHALDRLSALPKGKDFDTAFVNYSIDDHTREISELQSAESSAQSPEVKALLGKLVPAKQKHLEHAKELQAKLNSGQ
jgi:putative membrane protein